VMCKEFVSKHVEPVLATVHM